MSHWSPPLSLTFVRPVFWPTAGRSATAFALRSSASRIASSPILPPYEDSTPAAATRMPHPGCGSSSSAGGNRLRPGPRPAPDHAISVVDHDPAVHDRFAGLDVGFLDRQRHQRRRARPSRGGRGRPAGGLHRPRRGQHGGVRHREPARPPRTICFVSREDFGAATQRRRCASTSASSGSSGPRRSSPRKSSASSRRPAPSTPRSSPTGASGCSSTGSDATSPLTRPRSALHLPHGALIVA
jgi:hypothetical protein